MKKRKIVIIGGGPTGIGAAFRLNEIKHGDWMLYEKDSWLGGISSSRKTKDGFTWDLGGHVLFSHYKYFDDFIEKSLKGKYYKHNRESWIKQEHGWVPYPFQNNIRYLKPDEQIECLNGLLDLPRKAPKKNSNFIEWAQSVFGAGICRIFFKPYNEKVWAVPLEKMSKDWIAERVSVIDIKRLINNIIFKKDDVSWGPNNKFIFPKRGGTGAIFNGVLGIAGHDKFRLNSELTQIDIKSKKVEFNNEIVDNYNYLISSIPINILFNLIDNKTSEVKGLRKDVSRLVYNSVYVIGIGTEEIIKTSKCWTYFPSEKTPFYRLTFFHNYSPGNVPDGNVKKYSSLMCEVAVSEFVKLEEGKIIAECIRGLEKNGIIKEPKKIVSKAMYKIPYAYPVPTLDRDKILRKAQIFLMRHNIYSRGRFGAWKYEIGNMDHSFMQGVEVVDKILSGKEEITWLK